CLGEAELEVEIIDEQKRHREHERSEIPEARSVASEMDPSTHEAEHEERRGEQRLQEGVLRIRIAQPLPPEVEPPHADLLAERRLPLRQRRLPELSAVEIVHERVVRAFRERA